MNDDDAQCVNEADDRSACFKFREDYVECLHHKKEYRRENEIENERQRRNEEHANAKKEALLKEMRTFSWVTLVLFIALAISSGGAVDVRWANICTSFGPSTGSIL